MRRGQAITAPDPSLDPHPPAIQEERSVSESIHVLVPLQRMPEQPCPRWCVADHHGEPPGLRSHWTGHATVQPDLAPLLLVDLSQVDGLDPLVTLHEADCGPSRALSLDEAEAYAVAILNAVIRARAAVAS